MNTLKIDDLETSKDLDKTSLESISGGSVPTSSSAGFDLIKQFGPNVSTGAFGGGLLNLANTTVVAPQTALLFDFKDLVNIDL
jgi:hypothetical protein